jgi:hypothetical protein
VYEIEDEEFGEEREMMNKLRRKEVESKEEKKEEKEESEITESESEEGMICDVKVGEKKKKKMYLKKDWKIKEVKKRIIGKKFWNFEDVEIIVDGEEISESREVFEVVKREKKKAKCVCVEVKREMNIYVMLSSGRREYISVSCNTLISEIIKRMSLIDGEKEEKMMMIFGEKEIRRERTIGEMEIEDGDILILRKKSIFLFD